MREKLRNRGFRKLFKEKDKNKLAQIEIKFKRRNVLSSLMKMQATLSSTLKFKQSWKVTSNNIYRL